MTARRVFLAVVATAALSAWACSAAPTLSPDDAATAIAATLTSMAGPGPHRAAPSDTPPPPTTEPTTPPYAPSLRVVYTDGGNLRLRVDAAPPVVLTAAGSVESVRISADGLKVAYTRRPVVDLPVELRVVNADGTGDSLLMGPADFDALYPLGGALHNDLFQFEFLPGTHQLLLNTRSTFEGPGLAKRDDLIRIDTDTLARTLLLAPGGGGDFTASPDGTYLALVRPDAIEIRLADGSASGSGVIPYTPVITYSEYRYYAQPVWDPASSAIAVAIPSSDPLAPSTTGSVWRLPAGGSPSLLGTIPAQFFFFGTGHAPLVSPDLAQVAYTRATTTPNIWSLYRASPNGTGETPLATGDLTWGGWSPDGQRFTFTMGGPMAIQLGDLSGGSAPLVSGTDLRWFSSTEFLFLSGSAGAWTLNRGGVGMGSMPWATPSGDFVGFAFAYD